MSRPGPPPTRGPGRPGAPQRAVGAATPGTRSKRRPPGGTPVFPRPPSCSRPRTAALETAGARGPGRWLADTREQRPVAQAGHPALWAAPRGPGWPTGPSLGASLAAAPGWDQPGTGPPGVRPPSRWRSYGPTAPVAPGEHTRAAGAGSAWTRKPSTTHPHSGYATHGPSAHR